MNEQRVKTLKKLCKIAAIIAAAFFTIVAIVVNVVVTPTKLTPIALKYASQYLDAEVKIGSVEVTFFSSFPRFGVKLTDGLIVSNAFHKLPTDTTFARHDTLAVIGTLCVDLDLFNTLFADEIVIGRAELDNSTVRIYTDSLGRNNYDIFLSDTISSAGEKAEKSDEGSRSVIFKHVIIENSKIRYADKISKVHVGLKGLNLDVDGDLTLDNMDMDVHLEDRETSFKVDDTRYLRKLPMILDGHIAFDSSLGRYNFSETCIKLDGHDIDVDGYIGADSLGTDFNILYGLDSPSVEKLFSVIPNDVVGEKIVVESGSVVAEGYVKGRLDDNSKPIFGCHASVSDVKGHYEGMKRGVDDITAKFDAFINPQQPDSSFLNLEIFHFEGGNSEVESTVKVSELLGDANVSAKLKAHLDLMALLEVFPMPDVHAYGLVDANLNLKFNFNDIKRGNYGRIKVRGKFDVDSLAVSNKKQGFNLTNDAHVRFNGSDTLKVKARMNYLEYEQPGVIVRMIDFVGKAKTIPPYGKDVDTTSIVPIDGSFTANRLGIKVDSVRLYGKNIQSSLKFHPMKENKHYSHREASVVADTILSNIYGIKGFTKNINTSAMLEQIEDSTWNSDMFADVEYVRVNMPRYKMPLVATNTLVTQRDYTIRVERSHVRAGQTSMDVVATVHNLYRSLMMHQPLEATVNVDADTINYNELMAAVIEGDKKPIEMSSVMEDTTVVEHMKVDSALIAEETDSVPHRVVVIPNRIHFNFNSKINKFIYKNLQIDDIDGKIEVVNGCFVVKNLNFKQGGSKGISLLCYKGQSDRKRADVDFFVRWERADIGELISDMQLDTVMPMLSSFKGKVDCYMTIKSEFDSTMTPNLKTTEASIHMGGKRLTLLDGETFSKMSKMMMFKNKKENIIDTLSFNVLVDSGHIEVLPFVTNIDRYSAVVGGHQDFDMNLDYHISIIKSPLPFKAGVTIKGSPDNLDFDITTAKLKKKGTAVEQARNDSTSLRRRMKVIRDIFIMSGLPMPLQLQTLQERQEAEIKAKMAAVAAFLQHTEIEEEETEEEEIEEVTTVE